MYKNVLVMAVAALLTACGGGSSESAVQPAQQAQAIKDALDNVQANLPASKPFKGAFLTVEGVSVGWVSGDSFKVVAELAGRTVMDNPSKWDAQYKAMLSDKGMKVAAPGEAVGKSSVTGMTLYGPEKVAYVRLLAGGVLMVVEG